MKNLIWIVLLIVLVLFLYKSIDTRVPVVFEDVMEIKVTENTTSITLSKEDVDINDKFNYDYKIKDNSLYINTFKVYNKFYRNEAFLLKVSIDKGYNDFEKIYLNDVSGDKIIWTKEK